MSNCGLNVIQQTPLVSEQSVQCNITCSSCTRLACRDLAHWTISKTFEDHIEFLCAAALFFLIWWRVLCFVSNSCWTVVGFVVLFALYMTVCISLKGVNQKNVMKKDFLFAFPSYTLVGSFFVLNANQPQQCCWYTHSRHAAVSV